MRFALNRQAKIPLSKQIYQEITDRILSGYFPSGTRLPSIRKLAAELEVSPVTVMEAFDLLTAEQRIIRIQGKGTFVADLAQVEEQSQDAPPRLEFPDYLHRAQSLHYSQHPASIPFSLSVVHPDLLPASILSHSVRQLLDTHPEILVKYGEIQGDLTLRQAFADYLRRENIEVSPPDLLVTNGSQQGIDLVARCFLGPGDVVVTEDATYSGAIDVFRSRGAIVIPVPMDEEGLSIKHFTQLLDRYTPKLVYTIPTLQNPTGQTMSVRRRKQLLSLAEELNFLILEDDPWSELYFDTPPPPHMKPLDANGNVIYLKGLSKMLAPGCRVGFLTAEPSILRRLLATKTNADMGNPLLNQRIIVPIFANRSIDQLLGRLRRDLGQRRNLALQLLDQHAPDGVNWIAPAGGLNIWLSLPAGTNTIDLLALAKGQGVDFFPGSACYPVDIQTHHLRLSFSNVNPQQLTEGIPLLCEAMRTYLNQQELDHGSKPGF